MKKCYLLALVAMLSTSTVVFAEEKAEGLFAKNKCVACHKPDAKTVGPSLKDIAAKYAGDKDAAAKLEKKVREGGSGVWGKMAMPPTPAAVSNEDIKTMVAWMLSHK